jgi:hypothetical protein
MRDELLWEKQHEMWLLQEYGPVCIAVGIEIGQLSGTEVYFLANKIRAVVKREAEARFRTVKGVFETTDYVKCLRSKSATELSALRARVSK